tara:strand:- start:243 stop:491 length:249 start_codon:yes stop_codon:yes gene_type:complete
MDGLMNFTVYSRDGCPYCTKIQEVLRLAELKHVIYKLDRDFDRPGFYSQFGEGSTFPQVVLNGDNLGGCTETVQYLKENNLV